MSPTDESVKQVNVLKEVYKRDVKLEQLLHKQQPATKKSSRGRNKESSRHIRTAQTNPETPPGTTLL
jgi:hypothetical protein